MKTQHLLLLTLIFCGSIGTSNAQESVSEKFKKLRWLSGEWLRSNSKPGQHGYENWSRASDTRLIGIGVTMEGEKTIFVEQMELSIVGDDIFLNVSITGEPKPAQFKLTAISENSFTCENPEHDFPQKIAYTRKDDKVKAIVSGGGETLYYEFVAKKKSGR